MKYELPELEVILLDDIDIVTASCAPDVNGCSPADSVNFDWSSSFGC